MASITKRDGKRGPTYKVQVRMANNHHYTETFKNKKDAEEKAREIEKQIRDGRYSLISESKKRTLSEVIERYRKNVLPGIVRSKRGPVLDWWEKNYGKTLLKDLTPALLSEVRDRLVHAEIDGKQRSPATIWKYLMTLSAVLGKASGEWQLMEENPLSNVSKPSLPRGRTRFLDDDERDRLLQACKKSQNKYLYTIVVLAISSGMRRTELISLTWADVDFDRERIVLRQTKNDEIRILPLTGIAKDLLLALRENVLHNVTKINSLLVFPGNDPSKPVDFRSAWRRAVKACGLNNFVFHDLRHCFGSYMIMNGNSLNVVSNLLGHKSSNSNITKRYVHLSESYSKDVVAAMNDKIFNREAQ